MNIQKEPGAVFVQAIYFTEDSRIGNIYDCFVLDRGNYLAVWGEGCKYPDYYNTSTVQSLRGVGKPRINPFTGEPETPY